MKLHTLLVADDHPLIRKGMVTLLSESFPQAAILEAENGRDAFALLQSGRVQVALLDIDMPHQDGISVTSSLQGEQTTTKIIILTLYKEEWMIRRAFEAGASGFILKENAIAEIVHCIKTIMQGKRYLSTKIASPELRALVEPEKIVSRAAPKKNTLSKTEREVLLRVGRSQQNKEIAEEMHISVRTVENHRANIMKKLGLRGKNALLEYAFHQESKKQT